MTIGPLQPRGCREQKGTARPRTQSRNSFWQRITRDKFLFTFVFILLIASLIKVLHLLRGGGAFNEEDQKDRGLVGMRLERCVSLLALPTPMLVHSSRPSLACGCTTPHIFQNLNMDGTETGAQKQFHHSEQHLFHKTRLFTMATVRRIVV
ncbi:hypothetical protein EMCRGX_G020968 [Ephydatia muelleri]